MLIKQLIIFISLCLILTVSLALAAPNDIPNSKDHPLFSRFPGSYISNYEKNFNELNFATGTDPDGKEVREPHEGELTKIRYFHGDPSNQPSPLQVLRNYQNAIKQVGGEAVFERKPTDMDGGEATLKVAMNGKEYWVQIIPEIFSAPTQSYLLNIMEVAAMQQMIGANQLLDELNAKGFVTVYINFETGKANIKADSKPVIIELSKMLTTSPAIKVSIEGHTDDVGSNDDNKLLSENRAKSVMTALVESGIQETRLSAIGLGEGKPIADNTTEVGRAKNRRVEIVKKG